MEHEPTCTCASCDDVKHRLEHPTLIEGCYACKLDHIQFDAAWAPNHKHSPVPPRTASDPAWERGIASETRIDGSTMPYLKRDGSPIHLKEAGERRHELAGIRSRLASGPMAL